MEVYGFLTLIQICICIIIGLLFGSMLMFYWNYREIKNQTNYIHDLEQTLNDNKIWINN